MNPSSPILYLLLLVGCEVFRGRPAAVLDPTELDVHGMVLAHIDDDDDADSSNDGARGFGTAASEQSLEHLRGLGVDWVSLSAFAWLDDPCDQTLSPEFEAVGQETEIAVQAQIAQAHQAGMKVLLSPTLFVADGWRGHLGQCADGSAWTDDDWSAFQASYVDYVGRWADLAEGERVEMLSIGVEMVSTSSTHPEVLTQTLQTVRGRYTGLVTYTANWDEVGAVPFLADLDVIGINAFFPLTTETNATFDQLLMGATNVVSGLQELHAQTGKDILFTEVGFKSHPDAAIEPWAWPQDTQSSTVDQTYQANCYRAVLQATGQMEGFAGLFWWKWFTDLNDVHTDTPEEGPHGFTPQGKLAEEVLREAWAP